MKIPFQIVVFVCCFTSAVKSSEVFEANFATINPGTFQMGSPESEEGRRPNEDLHKVTLTSFFEIQTTEVTQEQWHKIRNRNPSMYKKAGFVITQIELSDLFGALVHLTYFPNPLRKKILDYRVGQTKPDDEVKRHLGI